MSAGGEAHAANGHFEGPLAGVVEGDLWQGIYRFDKVTVTRRAKLRLDDLDDFDDSRATLTARARASQAF